MHAAPWPERACAGQPPRALSRPRPRCAACWRPTRGTTPQPCAERAARARAAVAGPHQGAWGRACRQCYGGAPAARGGGGGRRAVLRFPDGGGSVMRGHRSCRAVPPMHGRAARAALRVALMLPSCGASCEDAAPANSSAVPAWAQPLIQYACLWVHSCGAPCHGARVHCTALGCSACWPSPTPTTTSVAVPLNRRSLRRRRWICSPSSMSGETTLSGADISGFSTFCKPHQV